MGRPMLSAEDYKGEYRRYKGHRWVAEKALGKPLPPGDVVHYWDENPKNNDPENLLICPDEAYHNLIHMRMEARKACGNPNWLKCYVCKAYDDPHNLLAVVKKGRNVTTFYNPSCRDAYRKQYKETHGRHI